MLQVMARNWWTLALRGVLAIILGILIFLNPAIALVSLITLFGAYMLVDGVFAIIAAVRDRASNPRWWVAILEGVVGIVAGILTFVLPGVTSLVLLYIVAAWALITGVMQIIAAIELRKEISGEFWLGLSGFLSALFGVLLIANPGDGLLTLLTLVAIYAIIGGVILIMLGLRLRGYSDTPSTTARSAA